MKTAELVRIFDQNPSDELVTKREAAIAAVAETIATSKSVDEIFGYAASLSEGIGAVKVSGPLAEMCIEALVDASPAFVAEGQEIQVLVCALGATLQVLADLKPSPSGRTAKEIFAAAVHAGLSFAPASSNSKVCRAVSEILNRSAAAFQVTGEVPRQRAQVPTLEIELEGSETAIEASEKVVAAVQPLIASLQSNAALDREELELLWFCLGDHSAVLNAKLSSQKSSVGLVAAALETAKLLRRLPSTSHVNMALRNVAAGKSRTLKTLVSETEAHRKVFSDYLRENIAKKYPSIVPVTSAILGLSQPGETEAREVSEWGRRLVLELGLTKLEQLSLV